MFCGVPCGRCWGSLLGPCRRAWCGQWCPLRGAGWGRSVASSKGGPGGIGGLPREMLGQSSVSYGRVWAGSVCGECWGGLVVSPIAVLAQGSAVSQRAALGAQRHPL